MSGVTGLSTMDGVLDLSARDSALGLSTVDGLLDGVLDRSGTFSTVRDGRQLTSRSINSSSPSPKICSCENNIKHKDN